MAVNQAYAANGICKTGDNAPDAKTAAFVLMVCGLTGWSFAG